MHPPRHQFYSPGSLWGLPFVEFEIVLLQFSPKTIQHTGPPHCIAESIQLIFIIVMKGVPRILVSFCRKPHHEHQLKRKPRPREVRDVDQIVDKRQRLVQRSIILNGLSHLTQMSIFSELHLYFWGFPTWYRTRQSQSMEFSLAALWRITTMWMLLTHTWATLIYWCDVLHRHSQLCCLYQFIYFVQCLAGCSPENHSST